MRPFPAVLLSIVTAAATVMVYDHLVRDPPAGPSTQPALLVEHSGRGAHGAALEAGPPPVLVGTGIEARLRQRLDDLERRMAALESSLGADAPAPEGPAPTETTVETKTTPSEANPAPEAIEQFRRLRKATLEEDLRRKVAHRIETALDGADIALTARQKERLVEAYKAFESRRDEIWSEAKTRGLESGPDVDWARVIADANAVIQREFTERIAAFLPYGDAEAISGALNAADSK